MVDTLYGATLVSWEWTRCERNDSLVLDHDEILVELLRRGRNRRENPAHTATLALSSGELRKTYDGFTILQHDREDLSNSVQKCRALLEVDISAIRE